MRVGQYGGVTMNSASSNKNKIGNASLPDYDKLQNCTKSTPAMSDEKFREAIIEQAKKDQAAGKYYTDGVKKLQKQYVSVVSPDRKSFISEALTQIFKNNKPQSRFKNLLELIFGDVKYEINDKGLRYAEFWNKDGNHLANYSNGEWTFYGTKEEIARESEFFGIYREAWGNAKRAAENTGSTATTSVPVGSDGEASLDVKA